MSLFKLNLHHSNHQRSRGFTLIEILVVAPIVILVIGAFVALALSMTGEVLTTRSSDTLLYRVQDALDRISTDVRSSSNFLATNNVTLTSPQGIDNGTGAFYNVSTTGTPELILDSTATTTNPNSTSSQPVYLTNSPNACNSSDLQQNATLHVNIIYFISGGSLWRRVIANSNYLTYPTVVCSMPWQRASCAPTVTGAMCATQDEQLLSNTTSLTMGIDYYPTANSTVANTVAVSTTSSTDARNSALAGLNTISVTLSASNTVAGRNYTRTATAKATRIAPSISPVTVAGSNTVPPAPVISAAYDPTSGVTFSWPMSSPAATYTIQYQLNGGSWTSGATNTSNTYYNLPMTSLYNGETVGLQVVASTSAGSSAASTASITTPKWIQFDFINFWMNWNGGYQTAAYTKTSAGLVVIEGNVRNTGSAVMGTIIATLPPAYRPSEPLIFGVGSSAGALGEIRITTDGNINFSTTAPSGWFALNTIAYMPATPSVSYTTYAPISPWYVYGSPPWALPSYVVDSVGRVYLKGLVGGGATDTTSTIATLPTSITPQYDLYLPLLSSDVWGDGVIRRSTAQSDILSLKGVNSWKTLQLLFLPSTYNKTAWNNMTLVNSWTNYDTTGTYPPLRFTKTLDGMVMIQGFIQAGAVNTVVATLPAGYRPAGRLIFDITSWDTYGTCDVGADGTITVTGSVNTGWVSLNNLYFMADQ